MSHETKLRPDLREREYWRSLEALADEPEAREFLEREFPVGASELPEGFSRRTMLKLMAASMSLAGLNGCRRPAENIVPYVQAPEDSIPGVPRHYATTMPFGHSAYGLVVESHDGRPTKIEGNDLHPTTAGASNVWIQAAILGLYDPDRAPGVRHRAGGEKPTAEAEAPATGPAAHGNAQHGEGDAGATPGGFEEKTWADFVAAWKELEKGHLENQGAGLAVLSEPFSSPTLARLALAFRERFPQAKWVNYEPISDENVVRGVELTTGQALQPVYHFEKAEVIVSIDADFLGTDPEGVANARGFAAGRRLKTNKDRMNRLWVVESGVTVTGAMADHRARLKSGRMGLFCAALTAELGAQGLALPAGDGVDPKSLGDLDPQWIKVLAQDLIEHRGKGLIVAGPQQPAEVHALVVALNQALGNVGTAVSHREAPDAERSGAEGLATLARAMQAGEVGALVVLGGNPVYDAPLINVQVDKQMVGEIPVFDAPGTPSFKELLSKVQTVVHFGTHLDETSLTSHWHLPQSHFLESWGDARAADGTLSVIQPLIEPLFGGRSNVEVLGLMATGEEKAGYDLVRETWQGILGSDSFEKAWRRVLHDGVLAESALPAINLAAQAQKVGEWLTALTKPAAEPAELELVFLPSPALYDGRFANNGWLQECPDPITKMTWDNAALISPKTAARLGLKNEDVVRLDCRTRTVELPVWITPGRAEDSVGVYLGYGREAAGRVGNGVGKNLYALRTAAEPGFDGAVKLSKTGATYAIAQTQDHGSMEGRDLIRETTLAHYHEHPDFMRHGGEHEERMPLWKEEKYAQGHQWGMTIDLTSCTGCNACVVACQSENNVPIVGKDQVSRGREMHWLRMDRYFVGEMETAEVAFQPVPCMQCETAPCEQVCPVAATVHDPEGLNSMVYNRCIGTRYCSNNCPYKVRRFNFYHYSKGAPEVMKMSRNPDVTVRSRGVMEKCTYCVQRINEKKIAAKREGRAVGDGEIRTACQQACPTRAIEFGDLTDKLSKVNEEKARDRNYVLLEHLNTRPRTSYLAKIRNPHPELAGHGPGAGNGSGNENGHGQDRGHGQGEA